MTKKAQYIAVFSSTINMISFGLAYGWPSPSLPKLFDKDSAIKITSDQGSWLSVMPFVGGLVGAPIAAILADKLGRKPLLLLTSVPYTASWLMIAFFQTAELFMIARAMAGLGGAGLYIVLPTYIAEVAEAEIRGKLGTWITAMWNLGVLMIFICGPLLTIRNMAFVAISIPVLFVVIFIWMPETPYFYLLKGKREEAKRVLNIFRKDEDIEKIIDDIEEELLITGRWLEIVKSPLNRKAIILVAALITIQECSGRSPFIFYSQIIFQEADKNIPAAYVAMVLAVIQLISSVVASFIVDIFGRKPLLIFSCVGSIICSVSEGLYFFFKCYMQYNMSIIKWLPVISLLLFIIVFNIGLGIMPVIAAGELLATNVKSSSMCILDFYDSIIIIVVAKLFQFSADAIGLYAPFWTFAMFDLFGIIFVVKCLPETKGLTLEEIHRILKA